MRHRLWPFLPILAALLGLGCTQWPQEGLEVEPSASVGERLKKAIKVRVRPIVSVHPAYVQLAPGETCVFAALVKELSRPAML